MTVKELREALSKFPDDTEVMTGIMTKKAESFGNIAHVYSVRQYAYGFFGDAIPCVLLADDGDDSDEEEREIEVFNED